MAIFRYNEQPGNYYAYLIEGHGDDANDGLTPETAVATLDALVTILEAYAGTSRRHAVIKKKRIYNEGITVTRTVSKPITFEFVGGCEIDGSGSARPTFYGINDNIYYAYFLNYGTDRINSGGSHGRNETFHYCKFRNSWLLQSGTTWGAANNHSLFNCIFIEQLMTHNSGYAATQFNFDTCVFINCSTPSTEACIKANTLKNSIFFNSTDFYYRAFDSITLNYCCVYPTIKLYGETGDYDQAALVALSLNLNGIGTNPQFTDATNGQYTVTSASPCLYRGEGGEHIGIGEGFFLNSNMLWFFQAAINNFQLTLGRLGFVDPFDNAYLRTNPIDVGAIITLERAELAAILPQVAGDFTSGPVVNSAYYPAYSNTITYHYGAGITEAAIKYRCLKNDALNQAPATETLYWERLTWWGVSHAAGKIVQYTDDKWYKANTITSTTWVAAEWDEVVMAHEWNIRVKVGRTYDEAEAAPFAIIPLNDNPFLDAAGLGNSDDDYDMTTAAPLVFRFVIIELHAKSLI